MKIRSLGIQTDLIFHEYDAEITDYGEFLAIKTPNNPNYRWGNYLLFDSAPQKTDMKRWQGLFEKHIGKLTHKLFAWDSPDGDLGEYAEFVAAGYSLERDIVQTSSKLIRPKAAKIDIELRPLDFRNELEPVITNHVQMRGDEDLEGYRKFWQQNALAYLKMIEAGAGLWFGAFFGDKLVADMGLFYKGNVARYQAVITLSEFQNKGIASNLIYYVGQYGFKHFGVKDLVIVADQSYYAKDIYYRLGFRGSEQLQALDLH